MTLYSWLKLDAKSVEKDHVYHNPPNLRTDQDLETSDIAWNQSEVLRQHPAT